jgi:nitrate/nitrite transporter NarK
MAWHGTADSVLPYTMLQEQVDQWTNAHGLSQTPASTAARVSGALVARVAPSDKVGTVTGLVGAAGGLGGFVPPLVMGFIYGQLGSYGLGLTLLAVTSALTLALTVTVVRSVMTRRTAEHASAR